MCKILINIDYHWLTYIKLKCLTVNLDTWRHGVSWNSLSCIEFSANSWTADQDRWLGSFNEVPEYQRRVSLGPAGDQQFIDVYTYIVKNGYRLPMVHGCSSYRYFQPITTNEGNGSHQGDQHWPGWHSAGIRGSHGISEFSWDLMASTRFFNDMDLMILN